MTREECKELEVSARRPLTDEGVTHPDQCQKLRLHGVEWSVPPRMSGLAVTFADGVPMNATSH